MESLVPLIGSAWLLLFIVAWVVLWSIWPLVVLLFFRSVMRDLRRIAAAQEHMAYDTPRQVVPTASQPMMATETREPHIALSAFGR